MSTLTPEQRAAAVFADWKREGVMPFDETHWMNQDDLAAIQGPIADAIREAIAVEREECAKLVEETSFENLPLSFRVLKQGLAAAIRARSRP